MSLKDLKNLKRDAKPVQDEDLEVHPATRKARSPPAPKAIVEISRFGAFTGQERAWLEKALHHYISTRCNRVANADMSSLERKCVEGSRALLVELRKQ